MRKFTSNYLLTTDGVFLKNGIVVANPDGLAIGFVDTKGDLREMEQLIFHSGILLPNFEFVKAAGSSVQSDETLSGQNLPEGTEKVSIQHFLDMAKQLQQQFQELTIPVIFDQLADRLCLAGFSKIYLPGIFRLTGANLADLKFSSECRLKKII